MSNQNEPNPPTQTLPVSETAKKKPSPLRRPLVAGILILVIIAVVVLGVLFWLHSRTYVSTDDAFIDIQSQYASPQVAGRVLRVLVRDYQDVKAGDVLVEIDPAEYQSKLDQALAGKTQSEAQVAQARAQLIVDQAQVEQAQANVTVAEVNLTNADVDLRRYVQLRQAITGSVSQQQMDTSTTRSQTAAAQLAVEQKALLAARAQLGYARSMVEAAQASVKNAEAAVELAQLELSYTKVRAQLNGRIANKSVAEGNYLQAGADLMAVVPTNVYVTANFKETQLTRMRTGQSAEVRVDAYPDLRLHGHVDSVQPASGQAFSVLPAQNATGNWVKIVQRVPVKIVLDQIPDDPQRRLSPGLSVEAKVTLQ
jgi:membrane fusion protein (multidrug efflux system)